MIWDPLFGYSGINYGFGYSSTWFTCCKELLWRGVSLDGYPMTEPPSTLTFARGHGIDNRQTFVLRS